jgi:Ca2+-binding EF-hand superfamily protein
MSRQILPAVVRRCDLTRAALGLLIASIGVIAPGPHGASAQEPTANFEKADADRNGALTPAEFRTFINMSADAGNGRAATIRSRGMYDRAFSTIDANRDGSISLDELRKAGP